MSTKEEMLSRLPPGSIGHRAATVALSTQFPDEARPLMQRIKFQVMEPFQDAESDAAHCTSQFYHKYYADSNPRILAIGINPSRLGGGLTGIPWTDPQTMKSVLGIESSKLLKGRKEPSGSFVWSFVNHPSFYGSPERFLSRVYFAALCPFGFTSNDKNANFYDDPKLLSSLRPFLVDCMKKNIEGIGCSRKVAVCLGAGKLRDVVESLNNEHHFFEEIIYLNHPRYIAQYRQSYMEEHMNEYAAGFRRAEELVFGSSIQVSAPSIEFAPREKSASSKKRGKKELGEDKKDEGAASSRPRTSKE